MKIENIEELKNFNINNNLLNYLKKIYTFENILNNPESRYLLLVSLISSDNSIDEKSASKLLEQVNFLNNSLDFMNLTDEIKEEIRNHLKKGNKILKRDIKDFKKEEKKKNKKDLEEPSYNGYQEGFEGITNNTFTF